MTGEMEEHSHNPAPMSVPQGPHHGGQPFRVMMMHHPSHHVPDLDAALEWFARVFERPSIPIATVLSAVGPPPGFPRDYSAYTPIADVLFDSIDPKRFVIDGVQRYESVVEPHLKDYGWYVEELPALYAELKRRGIRVTGTPGELLDSDDAPKMPSGIPAPFHTVREDTGVRNQFYSAEMPFPADVRTAPGWTLPPPAADDPLGIVCASHHTVLTRERERALRLVVDVLGGVVINEGRDDVRGTTGVYVHLAGSTLEYAESETGTAAETDWVRTAPDDVYHAITWQVVDLERAARHLDAQGVRIQARTDDRIVTDPVTSLGIPWGFVEKLVPGDPRA
jgi:catechol 2,3-dioxygenase-like lactoylglutathione lyase family enzyme